MASPSSLRKLRELMKGKLSPGENSIRDKDEENPEVALVSKKVNKKRKKLPGTKKGEGRDVDRLVREEDPEVVLVSKKLNKRRKKLPGTKMGERRDVDRLVREEDPEVVLVSKKLKTHPVSEPNASSRESIWESSEPLMGKKRKEGKGHAVLVGQDGSEVAPVAKKWKPEPVAKKWKPEPVPEDIRLSASSTVIVAYAPDMPHRYGHLLRSITFLLPYKSDGKAYECDPNRVKDLISRTRCGLCLFFQWVQRDKEMFCWIINISTNNSTQFLVNPAFVSEMLEVKVKRAACAFSLNFCSDKKWAGVKNALELVFSSPQHKTSEAPDNMYVFTRIDDCVYFRNIKINDFPNIAEGEPLDLKEVGPYFCLKLVDIHGETAVPYLPSDVVPQNKIKVCPIQYCSLSPELGSCIAPHSLYLNDENYTILIENGHDLSAFEGYNVSLEEFLAEQPLLKIKHIVGSKTGEECLFVRNIAKYIIKSILAYLVKLFSRDKCIKMKIIGRKHIFLKGSKVKFYGVEFVQFEENQAEDNVVCVVGLISGCFPEDLIPSDLSEMLDLLLSDPLHNLEAGKGDCSLLSAKERRELLVLLHTEYMTNVKPMLCGKDGDDPNGNLEEFFAGCPYIETWVDTMTKNTYLTEVASYNSVLGVL
ncbi:uncharacterized protein LOC119276512 [Triticum dicoccoides]|uniref:uncharacterized protein LOC119276512 n=1 Tax=Triticum dicoccoides TaxID=85692 RepID=UPI000E79A7FE|nr:uncharacterized protein LOC119276512 [Triticum dicoccoides]